MNQGRRWTVDEIKVLNSHLADAGAEDILKWAVGEYGDRLTLACSFGAEDVVLVDMLSRITVSPRVFFLDTGRLHQETYDVVDEIRKRYGIPIETYCPQAGALQELIGSKGVNSFYGSVENRRECCYIRKVEPLSRALGDVDAWITGLRRSQSATRHELMNVEIDEAHGGILKINPLADWSEEQVWEYISRFDVPYNRLHDLGFPSIGCAPCTRAVGPGEDVRAGRWWWESPEHKECGLHISESQAAV